MSVRSALAGCVVMTWLAVAALPVAAQDTGAPITWLIDVTVKPGKYQELEAASQKYDKPVLDALVANGSIMSYGLACQLVGPPSQSCMYWVTAADWSAMGKVEKAFSDSRKAMQADELKAMMDTVIGATDPTKETSSVVRHVVFGGTPGVSPKYLMRHVYKVKPGQGSAAVKMFKEHNVPVFEKLLADGVINGYGAAVPDMHVGDEWTHAFWTTFSDMSQIDAVDAAFEEAEKARGEALNETLAAAWREMHDMDAHWDSLMSISMYGGR